MNGDVAWMPGTRQPVTAVGDVAEGKMAVFADATGRTVVATDVPPGGVSSVNGQTGAVTLDAGDVGAAASVHTHVKSDITDFPTLATVATSGSYNDLSGKPTLATVATSGSYDDLSGKPTLATVATSGSYEDLSGKPTIPAPSYHGIASIMDVTQYPVQLDKQHDVYRVALATSLPTLNIYPDGLGLTSSQVFDFEIWIKLFTGGSTTLPGTWECVGTALDVTAGHTAYLACRVDSTGHVMYNQYYKA